MKYSFDANGSFGDLLNHCYVAAVGLEIVQVTLNEALVVREFIGKLQLKVFRQPVQPRHQKVELLQQRPKRGHPFRSRRAKLVLMQIPPIPCPEVAQLQYNLRVRTLMARQKAG
jgi:hypothetical protein